MTPFEQSVCDPNNFNMKGATKANLEAHGIGWPPPRGWRKAMRARILARQEGETPTRPIVIHAAIVGQMGSGFA